MYKFNHLHIMLDIFLAPPSTLETAFHRIDLLFIRIWMRCGLGCLTWILRGFPLITRLRNRRHSVFSNILHPILIQQSIITLLIILYFTLDGPHRPLHHATHVGSRLFELSLVPFSLLSLPRLFTFC